MSIDYVSDWVARIRTHLYTQFGDLPNLDAVAALLGRQFQDLEDALQGILTITSIEDSSGVQLDVIGKILGQTRGSLSDSVYRAYLRARILVNKSDGTSGDLYDVVNAMTQNENHLRVTNSPIRAFALRIYGPISIDLANAIVLFIGRAKEAAAAGNVEWQEAPDSDVFTFQVGTTLNVAASGGATTLTVVDATQFGSIGDTGMLRIDEGTATDETLAYIVASTTTLTVAATGSAHSRGAAIQRLGLPGNGFGFASSSTAGGVFAHAGRA